MCIMRSLTRRSVAYMAKQIHDEQKGKRKLPFITTLAWKPTSRWWELTKSYLPVVTFAINQSDAVTFRFSKT